MFHELGVLQVLPLLVYVFLVEVVFSRRHKGRTHPIFVQVLPWEVAQPRVVFHFFGSVVAKAVLGFSLYHFVDEVGRLDGPTAGHFALLDLNLLLEDVVSDLLARLAHVGPPPIHALVSHHAHRKVVHRGRVVLPTHHLRRHVLHGACLSCRVCSVRGRGSSYQH